MKLPEVAQESFLLAGSLFSFSCKPTKMRSLAGERLLRRCGTCGAQVILMEGVGTYVLLLRDCLCFCAAN